MFTVTKKKNKKNIIKKYLNTIYLHDVLITFSKEKFRKNFNINFDKEEVKIIYSTIIKYLKKKKILVLNSNQKMDLIYKKINKKILSI